MSGRPTAPAPAPGSSAPPRTAAASTCSPPAPAPTPPTSPTPRPPAMTPSSSPRDQLVPQDQDQLTDVYDVRVDGGLASQHRAAPPPGCTRRRLPRRRHPSPAPPAPAPPPSRARATRRSAAARPARAPQRPLRRQAPQAPQEAPPQAATTEPTTTGGPPMRTAKTTQPASSPLSSARRSPSRRSRRCRRPGAGAAGSRLDDRRRSPRRATCSPTRRTGIGFYNIARNQRRRRRPAGRSRSPTPSPPASPSIRLRRQSSITFKGQDEGQSAANVTCTVGPPVSCTMSGEVVNPGERFTVFIPVDVASPADDGTVVTNQASVSGGGATAASHTAQTTVSSTPASFGFQDLSTHSPRPTAPPRPRPAPTPTSYASNSAQHVPTTPFGGGSQQPSGRIAEDPHHDPSARGRRRSQRDAGSLHRGPVRTGLQPGGCPDASAVGVAHAVTGTFGFANSNDSVPLYNMVPAPGAPATFGFDASGFDLFVHLVGGVDPAGNYALSATANDILAVRERLGRHRRPLGRARPTRATTSGAASAATQSVSTGRPARSSPPTPPS